MTNLEIQKTKTGDNYKIFSEDYAKKIAPSIFAIAIGSIALSMAFNSLKVSGIMDEQRKICKECMKKGHIATADFGGKFRCKICHRLVTGVPSMGHGVTCINCQREGYCKYCGKRIIEII